MQLFEKLEYFTTQIDTTIIDEEREKTLQPLIEFIQEKVDKNDEVKLNFICTHNSRRSHLAQVWAQTAAHYFNVLNVFCYSGGTEATAIYPAVIETLKNTGFNICTMTSSDNPKYGIKYSENQASIVGFSKRWDDSSNPKDSFCAVMTCSEADSDCPVVFGAEKRVPIHYLDPKSFDNSPEKMEQYSKTSLKIASEMLFVFSQIKVNN